MGKNCFHYILYPIKQKRAGIDEIPKHPDHESEKQKLLLLWLKQSKTQNSWILENRFHHDIMANMPLHLLQIIETIIVIRANLVLF